MDETPQAQSGELRRLTSKFEPLTAAEQELLKQAPLGEWAKCGPSDEDKDNDPKDADKWEPKRHIRADLLAWLCADEQARKHIHPRGIKVRGADITGPLNLSFVKMPFPLKLFLCRVRDEIDLGRAEVSELTLQGSVVQAIAAGRLVVKNHVFFRNGFTANGEVGLVGAQIGGNLDCNTGTFVNQGGAAINADGINVAGSVFFQNGFTASGEVRLPDAQIGDNLQCNAGTFVNEGGAAINAEGLTVKGNVFLGKGANAQGQQIPFTAKGEVNLDGAQIGGQLDCSGGVFSNPSGDSLSAQRAIVKSSVFLRDGFRGDGNVDLVGAQIGGDFDLTGGNFQDAVLALIDASAATLYDSGLNDPAGPASSWTIWPSGDKGHYLLLDGFTYGRIGSLGQINVGKRLDWLARQPPSPFHPQPYLQLAKVIRGSGDDDGAQEVLIEMEARSRKGSIWSPLLRYTIGYGYDPIRAIWWAAGLTGLGWIIYRRSYLAGGMVPTDKDACANFREPGAQIPGHYLSFYPLVYSVENSLPLVKLGQDDKWQPDPEPDHPRVGAAPKLGYRGSWRPTPTPISRRRFFAPLERVLIAVGLRASTDANRTPSSLSRVGTSPRFVTWFLWFQILLGWLLATLFVAGVSGIVHK